MKSLRENINSLRGYRFVIAVFFVMAGNLIYAQDTQSPEPPVIQKVSVDFLTGFVDIHWQKSPSDDVMGYLIYKKIGTIWAVAGDTIFNSGSGFFTDTLAKSDEHAESYRMIAIDYARNTSTLTGFHTTTFANGLGFNNDCPPILQISWQKYLGWGSDLDHQVIHLLKYGGEVISTDTIAGSENTFTFSSIPDTSYCCFYIEAVHTDGRNVTSNLYCSDVVSYKTPDFIETNYVTVENYHSVEALFQVDTAAENIVKYIIWKLDCSECSADTILVTSDVHSPLIKIQDNILAERSKAWYYVSAIDQCNEEVIRSSITSNILLSVSNNNQLKADLSWARYEGFPGGIGGYRVYRSTDYKPMELLDELNPDELWYSDDLTEFVSQKVTGDFCYYVEAFQPDSLPDAFKSRSNTCCVSAGPLVFVPNAFTPDGNGDNDKFAPVVSFASPEDYLFVILDRWGNVCFESKIPGEGWDGRYKSGKIMEVGVYGYYLKFRTAENKYFEKSGQVTLIF